MKTTTLAALILAATLSACDGTDDPTTAVGLSADAGQAPACTLHPEKVTQEVRVTSASGDHGTTCAQQAAALAADGQVAVADGKIMGAPISLSNFRSYAAPGVTCNYDIEGSAVVTDAATGCHLTVNFTATVPIP